MDSVTQATSKSRSNFKLSKPAISRYVEHDALRSKDKYTRGRVDSILFANRCIMYPPTPVYVHKGGWARNYIHVGTHTIALRTLALSV